MHSNKKARLFGGRQEEQLEGPRLGLSQAMPVPARAPERSPGLCEAAWHSALPMLNPSSKQPHRRQRSRRKPKRNCSVRIRQASIHFREHS